MDKVPSLALRPMLLAHIADVMEHELRDAPMSQVDIYQAMASAWVKRESKWVNEKELLLFSRSLAADIFEKRALRGGDSAVGMTFLSWRRSGRSRSGSSI